MGERSEVAATLSQLRRAQAKKEEEALYQKRQTRSRKSRGEEEEEDGVWRSESDDEGVVIPEGPFVCLACGSAHERWFVCNNSSSRCSRREVLALQSKGVVSEAATRRFGREAVFGFLSRFLEQTVRSALTPRRAAATGPPSALAVQLYDEDEAEASSEVSASDDEEAGEEAEPSELLRWLDQARLQRDARFLEARPDRMLSAVPRDALQRALLFSDASTFAACAATCAALRAETRACAQAVFRHLVLSRFPVVALQLPHMGAVDFASLYRARAQPPARPKPADRSLDDDFLFTVELYDEARTHYFATVATEKLGNEVRRRDDVDGCALSTPPLPRDSLDFIHRDLSRSAADYDKWHSLLPRVRVTCLKKRSTDLIVLYDMGLEDTAAEGGPWFAEDAVNTDRLEEFVRHLRDEDQPISEVRPELDHDSGAIVVRFLAWLDGWDFSEPARHKDVRTLLTYYVSFQ